MVFANTKNPEFDRETPIKLVKHECSPDNETLLGVLFPFISVFLRRLKRMRLRYLISPYFFRFRKRWGSALTFRETEAGFLDNKTMDQDAGRQIILDGEGVLSVNGSNRSLVMQDNYQILLRQTKQLEILNEVARIATLDLELRPMLQRITDALMRKFDWEFVACISIDFESGVFICEALSTTLPTTICVGYRRALGSGVVGEVAMTGQPILLDDVQEHHNYVDTLPEACSELCVPVRHDGKIVALLNMESRRPAAFRDQLQLAETVAEQISGAIANAQLYEQIKRRARLLEMVSEVSRESLEASNLDSLLDHIVQYVHQQFALSIVSIFLVHEESSELEYAAYAGNLPFNAKKGDRWPVTQGVVGRAIRTEETQLVVDVGSDPDYFEGNQQVVAELVIPLRFQKQVIGAFNLESTEVEAFSTENLVVFKTFADQLAGAVQMSRVNRQLQQANEHLRQANQELLLLSSIDPLTDLYNRRHFDMTLLQEWRRGLRHQSLLSVIMIDIDSFKPFNDRYGHQQGDICLKQVAKALKENLCRPGDLVARYGGEEFIVLIESFNASQSEQMAEKLRAGVEKLMIRHECSTAGNVVTISVGLTCAVPREGLTPIDLIKEADDALYLAKRSGGNQVVVRHV